MYTPELFLLTPLSSNANGKICVGYTEPPQEGESGYKLMMRLERRRQARERQRARGKDAGHLVENLVMNELENGKGAGAG